MERQLRPGASPAFPAPRGPPRGGTARPQPARAAGHRGHSGHGTGNGNCPAAAAAASRSNTLPSTTRAEGTEPRSAQLSARKQGRNGDRTPDTCPQILALPFSVRGYPCWTHAQEGKRLSCRAEKAPLQVQLWFTDCTWLVLPQPLAPAPAPHSIPTATRAPPPESSLLSFPSTDPCPFLSRNIQF